MHAVLKTNPTEYWIIHAVNVLRHIIICVLYNSIILIEMGEKLSNEIESRALLWALAHKEQAQHDKWADSEMFIFISYYITVLNKKQMAVLNRDNVVVEVLIMNRVDAGRDVTMIVGLPSQDSCYSVV